MSEAWSSAGNESDSLFGLPAASTQASDSELCAEIRRHNPDSSIGRTAFGELYARHRLPALHVAMRINRDRSRAEDAVAEAFAKIWRAWGNGTGPKEAFKPYLMAAVRSESYRRTATNRATAAVEPDVLTFLAGKAPSDHASEIAERDQLARAFRTLPDTWQNAIMMIDIEGTPTAEAAESMNLSSNSFSSLLRRAREGLRTTYLQEHVEPSHPDCVEYSDELARYVRNQLGQKLTESMEAHLSDCRDCRRQSFRLRSLNTTFQAWITPAAIAAALIEIGHFSGKSALAAAGSGLSSTPSTGLEAADPTLFSTSAGGQTVAAASGTATSTSGFAIGAGVTTALKVAVAGIAATAALAAGTLTLTAMQSEPEPEAASSADSSPAPAPAASPIPAAWQIPAASPTPRAASGTEINTEASDVTPEQIPSASGGEGKAPETEDSRQEPVPKAPADQPETSAADDSSKHENSPNPTPVEDGSDSAEAPDQPAAQPEAPSADDAEEPADHAPPEEPTTEPDPEPSENPTEPPVAEEPDPSEPDEPALSDSSDDTDGSEAPAEADDSVEGADDSAESASDGTDNADDATDSADDGTEEDTSDDSDGKGGHHCHHHGRWHWCH